MKFHSITYKYDKKNKRYRFFFTGSHTDDMGDWQSSGNYGDLYGVNNHLVFIRFTGQIPDYVCDNIEEFFDYVTKMTGCVPEEDYGNNKKPRAIKRDCKNQF